MRLWDQMNPEDLCRQHLLGQWREGLGLWNILTLGKKGYANHPETKRWRGFERALWAVLFQTREAMLKRGWNPKPMPEYPEWTFEPGLHVQSPFRNPPPWDNQLETLRAKKCDCELTRKPLVEA